MKLALVGGGSVFLTNWTPHKRRENRKNNTSSFGLLLRSMPSSLFFVLIFPKRDGNLIFIHYIFDHIQPWNITYIRLLNKPNENEVALVKGKKYLQNATSLLKF